MAKRYMCIEDLEKEIQRLENSNHVALARRCEEAECVLNQYIAELQRLEEKGIALAAAGINIAQLEALAVSIYAE